MLDTVAACQPDSRATRVRERHYIRRSIGANQRRGSLTSSCAPRGQVPPSFPAPRGGCPRRRRKSVGSSLYSRVRTARLRACNRSRSRPRHGHSSRQSAWQARMGLGNAAGMRHLHPSGGRPYRQAKWILMSNHLKLTDLPKNFSFLSKGGGQGKNL